MIKQWLQKRRERHLHNNRDYYCKYWWGDRSGYNLSTEKCSICNPKGE